MNNLTTIQVENHLTEQFELEGGSLIFEKGFSGYYKSKLVKVIEGDFWTSYVLENLSDEDEETLENIKSELQ